MLKKLCNYPGCGELINPNERYCKEHQKEYKERKPFENSIRSNEGMYNTTKWRKLRAEHLKEQDYCVYCGAKENLQVDHIVAPRGNEDLFFSSENLQSVCGLCHRIKTANEILNRNNNK